MAQSHRDFSFWLSKVKRQVKSDHRERKAKMLSILASVVLLGIISTTVLSLGALAYFSRNLPSPTKLTEREIPQSTKINSRHGDLLYEIFADERRTLVTLDEVSSSLIQATLAVEDADFYQHHGFDWKGILRASFRIVTERRLEGGSTISQQLVKNTLLSPERTLTRKIKELILALQIERKYSKDDILQMYLNEAPYGGQAWGVQAASQMYFGKNVEDLSLAESAFLAGLPQAPTTYSPFGPYPENAKVRQKTVLHLMVKNSFISQDQADEAFLEELKFIPQGQNIKAPHFVMYVKERLEQAFGQKMVEQGGLKVTTTLDLGKQIIAEEEIKFQLDRLAQRRAKASNAGLIAVDPRNGEILAVVGSRDYFDVGHDGNVNVTLAARQPGSAIKPIMYVTAFKMGYTASTFLSDIRTCFPGGVGQPEFCPDESDGKYWGPMLLRDALANSRNVPAVKMLQMVGVQNVLDMAHTLGITTLNEPDRYGLSLTLGGGEVKPIDMAQAFSVFATGGVKHELISILKVEDSQGRVLLETKPDNGKRVLEEEYAYLINNILSDNEARKRLFGARNLLEIGRPATVKTGTTNDNRDAWTIGYTPQLATAVWVGNFDNSPMAPNIQGSTGATPIWHYFMTRSLEKEGVEEFKKPEGDKIVTATVDALSGKLPQSNGLPIRQEIFIKGTVPQQIDDFHQIVKVCKSKGLLATPYHEIVGDVEEKVFTYLKELNSAWQPYTDKWMEGQEAFSRPPTEKCPLTNDGQEIVEPVVVIKKPNDQEHLTVYSFGVEAEVYSDKTITKVEFYWDDASLKTLTSIPYTAKFNLSMNEEGEHKIMVKAYDSQGNVGSRAVTVYLPNKSSTLQPSATPVRTDVPSAE